MVRALACLRVLGLPLGLCSPEFYENQTLHRPYQASGPSPLPFSLTHLPTPGSVQSPPSPQALATQASGLIILWPVPLFALS